MHPSPLYLLVTICVTIVFAWPTIVSARQSAFTGRVVDSKTNQPIAGATVLCGRLEEGEAAPEMNVVRVVGSGRPFGPGYITQMHRRE